MGKYVRFSKYFIKNWASYTVHMRAKILLTVHCRFILLSNLPSLTFERKSIHVSPATGHGRILIQGVGVQLHSQKDFNWWKFGRNPLKKILKNLWNVLRTKTTKAPVATGLGLGFSGHVPLQLAYAYDKNAVEDNKNVFTNEHAMILKIIFTNVCVNISKWTTYKHIFPFFC